MSNETQHTPADHPGGEMSERTTKKARQVVQRLSEWYFAEGGDNDPDSPIDREDLDALHDLVRTAEATLRTPRGEGEAKFDVGDPVALRLAASKLEASGYDVLALRLRMIADQIKCVIAARRSKAQGEDRWEDLVFRPIVEAYNEAHAARTNGGNDATT